MKVFNVLNTFYCIIPDLKYFTAVFDFLTVYRTTEFANEFREGSMWMENICVSLKRLIYAVNKHKYKPEDNY